MDKGIPSPFWFTPSAIKPFKKTTLNQFVESEYTFKIIGMLITSLILYKRSKRFEYKKLLHFSFAFGASLPILSLIFSNNYFMYQLIFIFSGAFITAFGIARNGILVEISNNENRAIYAGISGAGSILPTIFPLIAGVIISFFGYYVIFIRKLKCR